MDVTEDCPFEEQEPRDSLGLLLHQRLEPLESDERDVQHIVHVELHEVVAEVELQAVWLAALGHALLEDARRHLP